MKSWEIVGYTYAADTYCPDDIAEVFAGEVGAPDSMGAEAILDAVATARGINRHDEHSFDSGDFPKVIFASMVESDDDRCGTCHEPLIGD